MALPADWNANDQYRSSTLDRELISSLVTLRRSIMAAVAVQQRFLALNLSSRWPSGTTEFVHQDKDAQTRQEQVDASSLIDFCRDHLLNDGTTSALTDAQAAGFLNRYAQG